MPTLPRSAMGRQAPSWLAALAIQASRLGNRRVVRCGYFADKLRDRSERFRVPPARNAATSHRMDLGRFIRKRAGGTFACRKLNATRRIPPAAGKITNEDRARPDLRPGRRRRCCALVRTSQRAAGGVFQIVSVGFDLSDRIKSASVVLSNRMRTPVTSANSQFVVEILLSTSDNNENLDC